MANRKKRKLDIVVAGTITRDIIHTVYGEEHSFGGAPYFDHLIFKGLGMRYGIFSRAPSSLRKEVYCSRNVTKDGLYLDEQIPTIDIFEKCDRTVAYVRNLPKPFHAKDIPKSFLKAKTLLISTLTDEISLKALNAIRRKFNGVVGLDLQGYTRPRKLLENGAEFKENYKRRPPNLEELLKCSDVVKLNKLEMERIGMRRESVARLARSNIDKTFIVTFGAAGAEMFHNGIAAMVKPKNKISVTHSVGNGDKFFALFMAMLAKGYSPEEALEKANVCITKYI